MKLQEKIDYVQSLIEDADDELRSVGKRMDELRAAKSHLNRELRKIIEEKESIDATLSGAKIGGSLPVVEDASVKYFADMAKDVPTGIHVLSPEQLQKKHDKDNSRGLTIDPTAL